MYLKVPSLEAALNQDPTEIAALFPSLGVSRGMYLLPSFPLEGQLRCLDLSILLSPLSPQTYPPPLIVLLFTSSPSTHPLTLSSHPLLFIFHSDSLHHFPTTLSRPILLDPHLLAPTIQAFSSRSS